VLYLSGQLLVYISDARNHKHKRLMEFQLHLSREFIDQLI